VPEPEKVRLDFDDIARLVVDLGEQLDPGDYDLMLAITRGGMVPGGLLGYLLGMRDIVVAAVAYYEGTERTAEPSFLQFPPDVLLHGRRVLVVDEVWDSGRTITAVCDRVRAAGGRPTTAVLHFKPGRSEVGGRPDFHAAVTDAWIVYPWAPLEAAAAAAGR
jgi:uncharacterized protein